MMARATPLKRDLFLRVGWLISFKNNLTASAKGTRTPAGPGLLGPLRRWMYPRTFRSRRVKKGDGHHYKDKG